MYAGKPIIGITGGIGSGKSFVARLFGELGCLVIDSDAQVREAYERAEVKGELRRWWGGEVFKEDGSVDRRAIARRVFGDDEARRRLEALLHPIVARMRDEAMAAHADDPGVVAYVWDTPLLHEAGLAEGCDAVVFVEAPREVRLGRVMASRGWDEGELARRENLQMPLDKKRALADDVVRNTAHADAVRVQVREVLSRTLTRRTQGQNPTPRRD